MSTQGRGFSSSPFDHQQMQQESCGICLQACGADQRAWVGVCPAFFCTDCGKRYLTTSIESNKLTSSLSVVCPCGVCMAPIPETVIESLVEPPVFAKYQAFVLAKKVETSPDLYWCPNPNCSQVVQRKKQASYICCSECNTKFCACCGDKHSSLVPCEWAGDKSFHRYRATGGVHHEGIKRCPSCKFFIEKNEGCSHMTCLKCHHQFCWRCLSLWDHGCTSGRLCKVKTVSNSRLWGSSYPGRVASKTVACILAPAVVAVAAGTVLAVVAVGGPPLVTYKAGKVVRRKHLAHKNQQRMSKRTSAQLVLQRGVYCMCYESLTFEALQRLFPTHRLAENVLSSGGNVSYKGEDHPAVLHFVDAQHTPTVDENSLLVTLEPPTSSEGLSDEDLRTHLSSQVESPLRSFIRLRYRNLSRMRPSDDEMSLFQSLNAHSITIALTRNDRPPLRRLRLARIPYDVDETIYVHRNQVEEMLHDLTEWEDFHIMMDD